MERKLFNRLIKSVKQAGKIMTGEMKPSRMFTCTEESEAKLVAPVPIDINSIKSCDCLRGLRYREDLTQKEMAARIGVTQGSLSAMERGKRPIGKDLAKKIADIFGGSYKSFL